MLSALMMMRRLAQALRVALRDEDFGRVLAAGLALIVIGTLAYSLGAGWSLVDGLYVAVATLTTSSVLDPALTITDPWLKILTAGYVLVGIGILSRSRAASAWVSSLPVPNSRRRSGRRNGPQVRRARDRRTRPCAGRRSCSRR